MHGGGSQNQLSLRGTWFIIVFTNGFIYRKLHHWYAQHCVSMFSNIPAAVHQTWGSSLGYCRDSAAHKQRWSLCALLKLSNIPYREGGELWFPLNHENVRLWIICLKVTCVQHLCLLNSTVYVPPYDSCGPWQRVLNVSCALPPLACV